MRELIDNFDLDLTITLVPSHRNLADVLTRVKKEWMMTDKPLTAINSGCIALNIADIHNKHHMGVERTLYLARKIDPAVSKEAVREVVRSCERCQSIDPPPVRHHSGEFSVGDNWKRLAIDVTHFRQAMYLPVIDCGPSRFALWRKLKRETADEVVAVIEELFFERGPVDEVLMDNSSTFHSTLLQQFFDKWSVSCFLGLPIDLVEMV